MRFVKYLNPAKYYAATRRRIAMQRYNLVAMQLAELDKFAALGLDRDAGIIRLNAALEEIGSAAYNDITGTDSAHWVLFAALSVSPRAACIKDVLEIGTFRGKTAHLLKVLFPHATVVTCDLPEHDPILTQSYRRDTPEGLAEYRATRDRRIRRPGITFVEANSFFLPEYAPGPYDLIWMDGGHLFPEVAWDLCNAWHMCRPGGILMCDDVIPDSRGKDAYASDESHQVLRYLAARTGQEPVYILKRFNPAWSADPVSRKFVAWLEKPLTQPPEIRPLRC